MAQNKGNKMQHSFSRLWDGYKTDKEAMQARNKLAKELRRQGKIVRCFTLSNQVKPYDGFGIVNGGTCSVYFLED